METLTWQIPPILAALAVIGLAIVWAYYHPRRR
jgi:4-hydroxybenzoate polyprenyltransferase